MVDLPAPIMPTSTTRRVPSAARISASGDALALLEGVGSDMSWLGCCGVGRAVPPPILPPPMAMLEHDPGKRTLATPYRIAARPERPGFRKDHAPQQARASQRSRARPPRP